MKFIAAILSLFLAVPVFGQTAPTTQPTQMILGTQGNWIWPGAFNGSGQSFASPHNAIRLGYEKQLGLTAIRVWSVIPNGAVAGAAGDNQTDVVNQVKQIVDEGKLAFITITPNQGQDFASPFINSTAVQKWIGQLFDAIEAATGKKVADILYCVECGNELYNHQIFWGGKTSEIPAFVEACATEIHSRGVKVGSPAWNGGPETVGQLTTLYAAFSDSVDFVDLHPYVPHPGVMIQQVYRAFNKPVTISEGSAEQTSPSQQQQAADRITAVTEAAQTGVCSAWFDYPGVVYPPQAKYGGMAGVVDQKGSTNNPFFIAAVTAATTIQAPQVKQANISGDVADYAKFQADTTRKVIPLSSASSLAQQWVGIETIGVQTPIVLNSWSGGYVIDFTVGTTEHLVFLTPAGKYSSKAFVSN